ncbi:MAG: hypothetical protein JNM60_01380 [Candidatus Competibacteraceae bacterium]|nr:hypothetical protein [Candidatus Competibacteraceae bacterium]
MMSYISPIHTVCPHCKRPVAVKPDQQHAHCAEHGQIVPMRSAVANPPLRPLLKPLALLA